MKPSSKVIIVAVLVAIPAFLTESAGPLGGFWPPHPTVPQPSGAQLPLFMILGAVEALAFGAGVAFLVFGYRTLTAKVAVPAPLARAAHLSITWLLCNWWAHDSLHIHNGLVLNGLLAIEYGFHFTLILAGLILVRFFLVATRVPAAA